MDIRGGWREGTGWDKGVGRKMGIRIGCRERGGGRRRRLEERRETRGGHVSGMNRRPEREEGPRSL